MSVALARKFLVGVTSDLTLASGWLVLSGITDLDPAVTPNLVDTSAYDTNGFSSMEPTFQDVVTTATFLRRSTAGVYDPGQELVRANVAQFGTAARVGLRWYDRFGGPEASSGVFIPSWKRAQTGVKDVESVTTTFQLTDGVFNPIITNPYAAAAVPVVALASPSGQGAGKIVTLSGQNFTGTTGITIGGVAVAAGAFTVEGDSVLVFVVPTGSAGSAPIIVTNAAGAGASFPYTRAT